MWCTDVKPTVVVVPGVAHATAPEPPGYVYTRTFGAVNYSNIRFKLIYYSWAVKMLVCLFRNYIACGRNVWGRFECMLMVRRADEEKRGEIGAVRGTGKVHVSGFKKGSERYYIFLQAKVSHSIGHPLWLKYPPSPRRSSWRSFINMLRTGSREKLLFCHLDMEPFRQSTWWNASDVWWHQGGVPERKVSGHTIWRSLMATLCTAEQICNRHQVVTW